MPEAAQLLALLGQWRSSHGGEQRTAGWHNTLGLFTEQVFSIGIVNSTQQPVLSARGMRNIPDAGLFGFDPTAYLGVYMPDTFWRDENAEN